jgi:hypothetical protein
MTTRFDNRSVDTFKKDIYFATKLEKYFFNKWLDVIKRSDDITVSSWEDNGCGNDGEFIEKGNTAGADYKISGYVTQHNGKQSVATKLVDEPLEIKWVPTAGKLTLKENDLKAYIREGASILLIYNSVNCGADLRKPKDYDFDKHIKLLDSKGQQIKYGIMWHDKVKDFYNDAKENGLVKPIFYMGNKPGVILKQEYYSKWFREEVWV